MRKMAKSLLPKILLVGISVCLTLLIMEGVMRLFYVPKEPLDLGAIEPWGPLYESGLTPPLNDLGFREEPLDDWVFSEGTVRVLFLGDSFTFGQGVKDGNKRFTDLIEKQLNADSVDGTKYHVYNAGIPGTEPRRWLEYLEELLPVYQPQYLFVVFFMRDGTDVCTSLRCYEAVIDEIKTKYTHNVFYRHSYLVQYFLNKLVWRDFSKYYTNQIVSGYTGSEAEKAIWYEQQGYLEAIQNLSLQNNVEVYLVIFPILYNLNNEYPFFTVDEEITDFALNSGLSVFSLTDGFMGYSAQTLWVSPNDQHPNKKGHQIAFEILYPYVKSVLPPDFAKGGS